MHKYVKSQRSLLPGASRFDNCIKTDGNMPFRVAKISWNEVCSSGIIFLERARAGEVTDLCEAGTMDFIA